MERVKYSGKIVEVVEFDVGSRVFEKARRSPGVRAIIVSGERILLSKEYRNELSGYDFRLPGGKVFDHLEEYKLHIDEDMVKFATDAVKKEIKEEVGFLIENPKLLKVSKAGATIEWDLYYFLVTKFKENANGQELEDGENITFDWYSFEEARDICLSGKMQEDRSVGVLLAWLIGNAKEKK